MPAVDAKFVFVGFKRRLEVVATLPVCDEDHLQLPAPVRLCDEPLGGRCRPVLWAVVEQQPALSVHEALFDLWPTHSVLVPQLVQHVGADVQVVHGQLYIHSALLCVFVLTCAWLSSGGHARDGRGWR